MRQCCPRVAYIESLRSPRTCILSPTWLVMDLVIHDTLSLCVCVFGMSDVDVSMRDVTSVGLVLLAYCDVGAIRCWCDDVGTM